MCFKDLLKYLTHDRAFFIDKFSGNLKYTIDKQKISNFGSMFHITFNFVVKTDFKLIGYRIYLINVINFQIRIS